MKAWILKRKHKENNDKYFTNILSFDRRTYGNLKPVKYDECFKTKQMAERYLSTMNEKWKNELYPVEVEIREVEE